MKQGINDRTLEKMMAMQHKSIAKIREMTKGEQPFAAEKVDPQLVIDALNSLGYEDMPMLVQEFGPDVMNRFIGEVKMMESRRQK